MGGGQKGKKPGDAPVQKGGISKKKGDAAKAADAPSKRKPKAKAKGDRADDDDALIASLISCAAGSEKLTKKEQQQDNVDMELVAALAAEACLPARHGGVDGRYEMLPRRPPALRNAARCNAALQAPGARLLR